MVADCECIIGLLLSLPTKTDVFQQVPEDANEEGRLGYTTLRCVVWHNSFWKLLEEVAQCSRTGYAHMCYDGIKCWLFLLILILSADYREQLGFKINILLTSFICIIYVGV